MEKRYCVYELCNKEFIPRRKDKIFCCKSCKKKYYYWRDRERTLKKRADAKPKKYCQMCKQVQIKNNYKYCSSCRIIKNKEWKRKEYKNHILQYRKHSRINYKKYIHSKPERMIRCLLRNRFRDALRRYTLTGKIKPSIEYGILYQKIIEKLEKDLGRKLTWEDLKNNHIHHMKELVTFDLEQPDEIVKAFSPENTVLISRERHKQISAEFLINWRNRNRKH